MFRFNKLTKEQALSKIKQYCAYQERSHGEVKDKLYSFGLTTKDIDEIISELINNDYLNEERFAIQYAGGKFRMKKWGRKKIQYGLQQKGVSNFNIKIGLKGIKEEEYIATLLKLAEEKWQSLAGEPNLQRQAKTTSYLLQKGFETDLISKVISEIKLS